MNPELVNEITQWTALTAAVLFTVSAGAYGIFGRWRETYVGFWYLATLAMIAGALWIRVFAYLVPPDTGLYLGVVVYGLFAICGMGTAPAIIHALYVERQRARDMEVRRW